MVALCDTDLARAERRAREWGIAPKLYADYARVLDDPSDGIREGRQPQQDVRAAAHMLQVALAIYESGHTSRPVSPESMT